VAEIEQIVAEALDKQRRLTSTRICFFTDLGRTTWEEATTPALRARLERLAEKASLSLFDVGDGQTQNAAITRLDVRDSLVVPGRETTFELDVQNFGNGALAAEQIELFVNGRRTHSQSVDLRPAGKVSTTFSHRFDSPGEQRIEARLADDILLVDNRRYLSLPIRESVRVLCIQGAANEAQHLVAALAPSRTQSPAIQPEVATESVLVERDLASYDAVFLLNLGRFSRDEAAVLNRYVRQGGALVIFLGDRVQLASYNEQLGDETQGRLLPARLESLAPTGDYRLNPLEYRHEIVKPFANHERAGLLTAPVWKYVRLAVIDPARSRTALAFDNGDAAIVTESIGRGRVVLVATAASTRSLDKSATPPTPWTVLSTWPSFPPLVQETLAYAIAPQRAQRNLIVGDELVGFLPPTATPGTLQMATPSERSERVPIQTDGVDLRWTYGETQSSGFYEVRLGPPNEFAQVFAVNVNTRESDLERVDAESLPEAFSHDEPVDRAAATSFSGGGEDLELFRWCLAGVLALLLAESLLAWRFGSGAR
jgi:hypothetical protein